jgi:hypothetical protein
MLRTLSFAAAIAAMLVIPFTEADARHGGGRGGGGGGRGMSAGHSIGARSFSGPRSIGISRSMGISRSVGINRLHVGPRRVAFVGPRFRHRRFVGLYGVGLYGTCWRWVPTVYGVRRVWVCDPYYGYY